MDDDENCALVTRKERKRPVNSLQVKNLADPFEYSEPSVASKIFMSPQFTPESAISQNVQREKYVVVSLPIIDIQKVWSRLKLRKHDNPNFSLSPYYS